MGSRIEIFPFPSSVSLSFSFGCPPEKINARYWNYFLKCAIFFFFLISKLLQNLQIFVPPKWRNNYRNAATNKIDFYETLDEVRNVGARFPRVEGSNDCVFEYLDKSRHQRGGTGLASIIRVEIQKGWFNMGCRGKEELSFETGFLPFSFFFVK